MPLEDGTCDDIALQANGRGDLVEVMALARPGWRRTMLLQTTACALLRSAVVRFGDQPELPEHPGDVHDDAALDQLRLPEAGTRAGGRRVLP
jgi:hypothetical protein